MPDIDFDKIEAAGYGDVENSAEYDILPAGGYIGEVMASCHGDGKFRIDLTIDIAEGPYANHYASDPFYDDKPWAHQCHMYYTQRSLPFLKRNLQAFCASNPGFNAYQAFLDHDWEAFVGKRIGIVLGHEEARRASDGSTYVRPDWFHADLAPVSMIEAGGYQEKPLRKLEGPTVPTVQNDAVPRKDKPQFI